MKFLHPHPFKILSRNIFIKHCTYIVIYYNLGFVFHLTVILYFMFLIEISYLISISVSIPLSVVCFFWLHSSMYDVTMRPMTSSLLPWIRDVIHNVLTHYSHSNVYLYDVTNRNVMEMLTSALY